MKTVQRWLAVLALAAGIAATPAHAGRTCEEGKLTTQALERGLNLAARTSAALDASGQKVVVLARAGQDLTKYGLQYSHLGFAYRQPDGAWRVLHKLNTCGTAESAIYRQGLGEFFLDTPWRYEAAWVVPTKEVQDKLLPLLQDNVRAVTLHTKPYSIVSYAWGQKYQQSNQWALETLAMAMEPSATTRERAQAWLLLKGYQPTTLKIGAMTRLGGRVTAVNVAFDDHPGEKRFSDRIETVTVDSVFLWMMHRGLGALPEVVLTPAPR